ncbi:MAG TPA: hypothetical protein VHC86_10165 [Opitutaceae bacterium]|nr:hypothetical protein [Opitutaceae bacterium]
MSRPDPIIYSEILYIQKIIADETWLEGERRRCWVSPDDPIVRENVCRIVLRIGQQLRDSIAAELALPAAGPQNRAA